MTKAKVLPLMQCPHAQLTDQNVAGKLAGREAGQRRIERQHQHRIHAGCGQQTQALGHAA